MKNLILGVLFVITVNLVNGQNGTTTVPPSTTTVDIATKCARQNSSCEVCVKTPECLWCEGVTQKCRPYPVGQIIPHPDFCPLDNARWGVCWVNYKILLIVMGSLAGVILLSLCCCVYCCCCRSKKNSRKYMKEEAKLARQEEERKARQQERRAERQTKLDEIRQKYGLVKDDNPYQRFDEC